MICVILIQFIQTTKSNLFRVIYQINIENMKVFFSKGFHQTISKICNLILMFNKDLKSKRFI